MKKAISLLLLAILLFSITGCGKGVGLTEDAIKTALSERHALDGTLTIKGKTDDVTAFTYTIENIDTEIALDRDIAVSSFTLIIHNQSSKLSSKEFKSVEFYNTIMIVDYLLRSGTDEATEDVSIDYIKDLADAVCDGEILHWNGWDVSVDVDEKNETVAIVAKLK